VCVRSTGEFEKPRQGGGGWRSELMILASCKEPHEMLFGTKPFMQAKFCAE
jgi:hypothetical protein